MSKARHAKTLLLVLSAFAITGCNETITVSSSSTQESSQSVDSSVSSSTSSSSSSSDVSTVEATEIKLNIEKNILEVGESLSFSYALAPEGATNQVTVTSSRPDYVAIEGNTLKALKITDDAVPVVQITAATDNGLSSQVSLKVVYPYASAVTRDLLPALSASKAKEQVAVNAATYEVVSYGANDETLLAKQNVEATPYAGKQNELKVVLQEGESTETRRIVHAEEAGKYLQLTQSQTATGWKSMSFVGANTSQTIVNAASSSQEIDRSKADMALSTIAYAAPNQVAFYGFGDLLQNYFLGSNDFLSSSVVQNFQAAKTDLSYSFKADAISGSSFYERSLDVTFLANGMLSSWDAQEIRYAYNTDTNVKGDRVSRTTYRGSYKTGDKKANADGAFDLNDRFYQQYDVIISAEKNATKSDAVFYAGKTYNVLLSNILPATAVDAMESFELTCSSEDAYVSSSSQYFGFPSSFIGDVTITVKTAKTSVTVPLTISAPVVSSLTMVSLPSTATLAAAQAGIDFSVAPTPSNATMNLTSATLTDNTCGGSVTITDATKGTLHFVATQAGAATITVADATGANVSGTITVTAASGVTVADVVKKLTTSTLTVKNNSDFDSFAMTADEEDPTKGTYTAKVWGPSSVLTRTGTFVVAEGSLGNFDLTLTPASSGKIAFIPQQTISLTPDFTSFTAKYLDVYGDEYTFTVTLS